jgi:hypothetical protein
MGQGAFVDMGYGYDKRWGNVGGTAMLVAPRYTTAFASESPPWFFEPRELPDIYISSRPVNQSWLSQRSPGYSVYDTWSFHYENNGVNEDQLRSDGSAWQLVDNSVDEGTNGMDDMGSYSDGYTTAPRLGVDDTGERETVPPYDRPLRGLQVLMRVYEPDSRAIRQVRVNQHFMPE